MKAGMKVRTRSGRLGTIQRKPYRMDLYQLVRFDGGVVSWIRTDLLSSQRRAKNGKN